MKIQAQWQSKMRFVASGSEHQISMDAKKPIGEGTALNPKELVLAGLCGCTAMDVVAFLRKHKQEANSLNVEAHTELTEGYPAVFTTVELVFHVEGTTEPKTLIEAVELSQSKYCGVSAMLAKAVPIHYTIELNGNKIHAGVASFSA